MKIVKFRVRPQLNLPIDDLKLLLIFLFDIIDRLRAVIVKFDFVIAFGLVQEIYVNRNLFTSENLKLVISQIRDLTLAETEELSEFFNLNFDIPNDQLELLIEQGVAFVPEGYALLMRNLRFGGRVVDWYNSFGEIRDISASDFIKDLPADLYAQAA